MQRSVKELKERSQSALRTPKLVDIASTFLPSAAYKEALRVTSSDRLAKACRWLAILRRDHVAEFQSFW